MRLVRYFFGYLNAVVEVAVGVNYDLVVGLQAGNDFDGVGAGQTGLDEAPPDSFPFRHVRRQAVHFAVNGLRRDEQRLLATGDGHLLLREHPGALIL